MSSIFWNKAKATIGPGIVERTASAHKVTKSLEQNWMNYQFVTFDAELMVCKILKLIGYPNQFSEINLHIALRINADPCTPDQSHGNVKWHSNCAKQCGGSSKMKNRPTIRSCNCISGY